MSDGARFSEFGLPVGRLQDAIALQLLKFHDIKGFVDYASPGPHQNSLLLSMKKFLIFKTFISMISNISAISRWIFTTNPHIGWVWKKLNASKWRASCENASFNDFVFKRQILKINLVSVRLLLRSQEQIVSWSLCNCRLKCKIYVPVDYLNLQSWSEFMIRTMNLVYLMQYLIGKYSSKSSSPFQTYFLPLWYILALTQDS